MEELKPKEIKYEMNTTDKIYLVSCSVLFIYVLFKSVK
jgi:hypothetical protein